jgi:GNAT superfamily N-acetyltransferase
MTIEKTSISYIILSLISDLEQTYNEYLVVEKTDRTDGCYHELELSVKNIFLIDTQHKCFDEMDCHIPTWRVIHENDSSFSDGILKFKTFFVDDNNRGRGIGSWLLDTIIEWGKVNYPNALVDIDIKPFDILDKERVLNLYSKRNVSKGVNIDQTLTFFEENHKIKILDTKEIVKIGWTTLAQVIQSREELIRKNLNQSYNSKKSLNRAYLIIFILVITILRILLFK